MIYDVVFPVSLYDYMSDMNRDRNAADSMDGANQYRTQQAKAFRKKKSRRKMAAHTKRRNRG